MKRWDAGRLEWQSRQVEREELRGGVGSDTPVAPAVWQVFQNRFFRLKMKNQEKR